MILRPRSFLWIECHWGNGICNSSKLPEQYQENSLIIVTVCLVLSVTLHFNVIHIFNCTRKDEDNPIFSGLVLLLYFILQGIGKTASYSFFVISPLTAAQLLGMYFSEVVNISVLHKWEMHSFLVFASHIIIKMLSEPRHKPYNCSELEAAFLLFW